MAKPGTAPTALAILLAAGLAVAAEWWEKKPYTQWSDKEVQRMMDNSPWGKIHTVTIMNPMTTGDRSYRTVGSGDLEREKKNLFHLHFLTAKPIRLAIVRKMTLAKDARIENAVLERFIAQTDERNIIVLMSLTAVPEGSSSFSGYRATLMKLSTPALITNTFLATKTGKRVYLTRYEPPGPDGLGARFYFPRLMEDGTPFASIGDTEVRFETAITLTESGTFSGIPGTAEENERTDRIWMQFDLGKMLFEGKLEI